MKARTYAAVLSTLLSFSFASEANASLQLSFSGVGNSQVSITGTGSGAGQGANFKFVNSTTTSAGWGFAISSSDSGSQSSVGLLGNIGGTYSYLYSGITTVGGSQSASLTTTGGLLTISDGVNLLTGTVTGVDIFTLGTNVGVNSGGSINLSGVTYAGANADLVQLKNEANAQGGSVTISFTFNPAKTLKQLATQPSNHTSYSGSITTVTPEPSSMAIAGLSALGMIGYGLRRRKAKAA